MNEDFKIKLELQIDEIQRKLTSVKNSFVDVGDTISSSVQKVDNLNGAVSKLATTSKSVSAMSGLSSTIGKIATSAGTLGITGASSVGKLTTALGTMKGTASASSAGLFGVALGVGAIYAGYKGLVAITRPAMDAVEVTNMFAIALGDMANEADETINSLNALYGLDPTNMRESIGEFALLSRSMGFTTEQAKNLSTSSYKLALDLSSVKNVPLAEVINDMKSGLVGQTETMYKYGVDITEASLKTEALAQGIDKSVRQMTQGEKMALRYSLMLRQTGLYHGDFAKTINNPANQLRVLQERFKTLARVIGQIFLPVLGWIVPIISKIVYGITFMITLIARLFGKKIDINAPVKELNNSLGSSAGLVDDMDTGTGNMAKNTKKATDHAKELKRVLMGIDQINVLEDLTGNKKEFDDLTGGTGGKIGGIGGTMPPSSFNVPVIPELDTEALDGITDTIEEFMEQLETGELFTSSGMILTWWDENIGDPVKEWLTEKVQEWKDGWADAWNEFIEGLKLDWTTLKEDIGRIWNDLKDSWKNVWKNIGAWFKENVTGPIAKLFSDAWNDIKSVFSPTYEWFKLKFTYAVNAIKSGFSGVTSFFSDIWKGIKSAFSSVSTWFKDTFTKAWTKVKNVFSTGGKIFSGIKSGISSVFKSVVNGLIGGINAVISVPFKAINGMLNKIRSVKIAGWKPFQNSWKSNPISTPKIPKLARGGIVDSATPFVAGESGSEVVMPLERNVQWMDKIGKRIANQVSGSSNISKNDIKVAFKEALNEANMGDTILYIGNEQIARASNKGNKLINRRYKTSTA